MSKRVLVSGGTGFIGRHLCRALVLSGFVVRAAVRSPIAQEHPASEFVMIGEIGPQTRWDQALQRVDYVVHLAGLAHQIGKVVPAEHYHHVNAEGTAALAKAVAVSPGVRRLVFVSSIGAVCRSSNQPVTRATPCNPDSDYGRSKLEAEQHLAAILGANPADFTILRPTLVYGPGNPGNMLRLLQLIRSGLPLPFGSIKNRRSFVYVENLVDVIIKSLTHPGASHQTFNVSDSEVLSTVELIRLIAKVSCRSAALVPFPSAGLKLLGRVGDLASRAAGRSLGIDSYSVDRLLSSLEVDNSELCRALDWTPPFTPEQGLERTLQPSSS